ncbi:hypothetical protein [Streptomyces sp. R02]|uniref:Gene transfer agent family protein n=1 Tax=Streptomyces sp. R02 TaxID=3238623 RepID=A0AB39LPN2_9ACTN
MSDFIAIGTDTSGREVMAQRGGRLEGAARFESAAMLHALVTAVMEGGAATDAELAAFTAPLAEALGEVLGVLRTGQRAGAAAAMWQVLRGEADAVREPVYGDAARALGEALKRSQGGGAL